MAEPREDGAEKTMKGDGDGLMNFARQLNDYADRLEHAQHEHCSSSGLWVPSRSSTLRNSD